MSYPYRQKGRTIKVTTPEDNREKGHPHRPLRLPGVERRCLRVKTKTNPIEGPQRSLELKNGTNPKDNIPFMI